MPRLATDAIEGYTFPYLYKLLTCLNTNRLSRIFAVLIPAPGHACDLSRVSLSCVSITAEGYAVRKLLDTRSEQPPSSAVAETALQSPSVLLPPLPPVPPPPVVVAAFSSGRRSNPRQSYLLFLLSVPAGTCLVLVQGKPNRFRKSWATYVSRWQEDTFVTLAAHVGYRVMASNIWNTSRVRVHHQAEAAVTYKTETAD